MGNERVEGYAEGFRIGWNKAMELTNKVIDNFCFGNTEESIEVKRALKEEFINQKDSEVKA